MTFNTIEDMIAAIYDKKIGFKPYYKWMTFNTSSAIACFIHSSSSKVLNLIINGWPSIQNTKIYSKKPVHIVLNLIINGWPSIPLPKGWMSYLC